MKKGRIINIIENYSGQEYGFITCDNVDYYFDDRYVASGTMADFYVDDSVLFEPSTNPYKPSQKVAKNVTLNLGKITEQETSLPKDIKHKVVPNKQLAVDYVAPEQAESNSNMWYKAKRRDGLILRDFSVEETTILDKLAKTLYHTNAGHFKPRDKGIEYGYSLFGPTKQFVMRFGLEKVEFAAILCNKEDFQRRTLEETFVYLTQYVIPKVRLIGHFYVLITKYEKIVEELEKPDVQRVIPYSVIPFSYSELVNTPDNEMEAFVLSRFKKFLFERNFFTYAEPISDRLFLFGGRDAYARSIADRCLSGDHSGIFGLRKSGKTSVVNAVKQELDFRKVFYVGYRCIAFARHDWYVALEKITRDVYEKIGEVLPAATYTEINAIELFSKHIDAVMPKVNNRMVLIFDEIEQIAVDSTFDSKWQDAISFHLFWSAIVDYCENHPNHLSLLIAGINPSISELDVLPIRTGGAAPRNPMCKKLSNDHYLTPFVFQQTKRMVNDLGKFMGYKFDDDVCYALQADFGGHPFFTRQMCKTIVAHVKKHNLKKDDDIWFTVTRPLYAAVKETGDYEVESIQWCKDILQELKLCYPEEYALLRNIANKDTASIELIRKSTRYIPHLIGYGLVRFDEASREMEISIDVVRNYLIREGVYKKPFAQMTVNEIDEEIQAGIRLCEAPLRKLITDVLYAQLPRVKTAEFIKATPSFARDNKNKNLDGLTVPQLLDPRRTTLHFYVLKDIICGYDNTFKQHFLLFENKLYPYTKAEIESYLSNLYVARNAADHHFEVHNEGTLNNFRSSLAEVQKLLCELGYIEETN